MTPQKRNPVGGPGSGNGLGNGTGTAPGCNHTTPPAELLLARLDRVKQTGPDSWLACCPAHDDRNPSLSIKQVSDKLLVKCMAHCETGDVMAAVGLSLSDLFDRPLTHNGKPLDHRQRRRYGQAQDALKVLDFEALIVQMAADDMAGGFALDPDHRKRLQIAVDRIKAIRGIAA